MLSSGLLLRICKNKFFQFYIADYYAIVMAVLDNIHNLIEDLLSFAFLQSFKIKEEEQFNFLNQNNNSGMILKKFKEKRQCKNSNRTRSGAVFLRLKQFITQFPFDLIRCFTLSEQKPRTLNHFVIQHDLHKFTFSFLSCNCAGRHDGTRRMHTRRCCQLWFHWICIRTRCDSLCNKA